VRVSGLLVTGLCNNDAWTTICSYAIGSQDGKQTRRKYVQASSLLTDTSYCRSGWNKCGSRVDAACCLAREFDIDLGKFQEQSFELMNVDLGRNP